MLEQRKMTNPITEIEKMNARLRSRNQALEKMADDLEWLIGEPPGRWLWTGTQRDLAELVHRVWMQRRLYDDRALPYTQRQLARRAFSAVGREMPRWLTRIICDTEQRYDADLSLTARYERWADEDNIIHHFLIPNRQ